jgi:hypothetical protein
LLVGVSLFYPFFLHLSCFLFPPNSNDSTCDFDSITSFSELANLNISSHTSTLQMTLTLCSPPTAESFGDKPTKKAFTEHFAKVRKLNKNLVASGTSAPTTNTKGRSGGGVVKKKAPARKTTAAKHGKKAVADYDSDSDEDAEDSDGQVKKIKAMGKGKKNAAAADEEIEVKVKPEPMSEDDEEEEVSFMKKKKKSGRAASTAASAAIAGASAGDDAEGSADDSDVTKYEESEDEAEV